MRADNGVPSPLPCPSPSVFFAAVALWSRVLNIKFSCLLVFFFSLSCSLAGRKAVGSLGNSAPAGSFHRSHRRQQLKSSRIRSKWQKDHNFIPEAAELGIFARIGKEGRLAPKASGVCTWYGCRGDSRIILIAAFELVSDLAFCSSLRRFLARDNGSLDDLV